MPSLKEVAQIIREDNDVIINNQDKQTESLDGINKNFDRFFTLQERDKLDRFERRKEEDRKRPRGVGAARTGAMAGIAAGAGLLFNPAALLKAMLNPKILLGIVGVLAIKPAFAALRLAAQGLTNLMDDAAKTQRGLNRFNAKELENKEKAAAKAAKAEEARLKTEEKLATQRARQAQAEMVKARAEEQRQIKAKADAEARAKASEIARQAEINYSKSLEESEDLRLKKLVQQDVRATALRNADLAREIRGMRGGFLKGRLDLQTDAVKALSASIDATPRAGSLGGGLGGGGFDTDAGKMTIPDSLRSAKPVGGLMEDGPVMGTGETPSQKATRLLMADMDSMKAAGFEAIETSNGGIRFVSSTNRNKFLPAESVLESVKRAKTKMALPDRSNALARSARALGRATVIGDVALIGLTAGATAIEDAEAAGEQLTKAKLRATYAADFLALPGHLRDLVRMGANAVAGYTGGEQLEPTNAGQTMRVAIADALVSFESALGIGMGAVSPERQAQLMEINKKTMEQISSAVDYLSGKDRENELAVEDVMRQYGGFGTTPQAGFQIPNMSATTDNSVTNISNNGYAISGPSGAGDKSHLRSRIGND